MAVDIIKLEERIDRVTAGAVEVSDALGGLRFQNMMEVMEFAKMMAVADKAVPPHLRANPGMCLAVCVQALEWRFSPFAVANKSYEVQGRLSFESQLVHAVIEQRAPIIGRLRHTFEGEGDARICIVTARLRETGEILEYKSPQFGKIQPKNSPLWKTKPDLQLFYNTSRDFCRVYFPDVLLGVYAEDELRDHLGPDNAKDVTDKPGVASRLTGRRGRGFDQKHVENETARGVVDQSNSDASADAGAETGSASSVPSNSNSSEAESAPGLSPQTKPVPDEGSPVSTGAGAEHGSASDVATDTPDAEPKQAGVGGTQAVANGTGLPELPADWPQKYAAALCAAQTIGSLTRYATKFWEGLGIAYADVKKTSDYDKAEAIYLAVKDHFKDHEARDVALRKLGAA